MSSSAATKASLTTTYDLEVPFRLRLATLSDLARIYSDAEWANLNLSSSVHSGLPPPGMTMDKNPPESQGDAGVPLPYIAGEVAGTTDSLTPGDLYWTTFAQYVVGITSERETQLLQKVLTVVAGLPGAWNDPLTYPIVYEVGAGGHMRWIQATFKGDLGGVEQFQHKLDLGAPGNDPTLSEGDALTLAQDLATKWAAAWTAGHLAGFSSDVRWTEVGVVEMTATSATDKEGKGGNATGSYGTQWWAWPVGTGPVGTAAVSLPYEVACCVTLQSDQRGSRGRGRFYLPPFDTTSMVVGGRFNPGQTHDAATTIGGFFNAVIAAHPFGPVVVSRRALQLHEVKQVLVGAVPDSQRRRRRSQDEARWVAWTAA